MTRWSDHGNPATPPEPKGIEERIEDLEKRVASNERRVRWREVRQAVAYVLILATAAWSYVTAGEQIDRVDKLSRNSVVLTNNLQHAVVESCRENGNARAEVQREQLHEEIQEAKHPDPKVFRALVESGIPPEIIREASEKTVVKLEGRLARVKIVNCASQYHIRPSGQRDR